eukprot:6244238-Prymnesium_polylepis.1
MQPSAHQHTLDVPRRRAKREGRQRAAVERAGVVQRAAGGVEPEREPHAAHLEARRPQVRPEPRSRGRRVAH